MPKGKPVTYDISPTHHFVMPIPECGCWIWTGSISTTGYGHCRIRGTDMKAHRLAWEQHKGPIPEGLSVLHKCDVRTCVNPNHLFLGTHTDNMRDMFAKGRGGRLKMVATRRERGIGRGENHVSAKLTDAQATEILHSRESGVELSRKYGISQGIVSEIRTRKKWRHIS